jgi:hypothetical protein
MRLRRSAKRVTKTHLFNDIIDGCHRSIISNSVSNANGHAVLEEPMVDGHSVQGAGSRSQRESDLHTVAKKNVYCCPDEWWHTDNLWLP